MRKNRIVIFSLILFVLGPAFGEKNKPLRVGVTVAGPPIEFQKWNDWAGLEPDLARSFGKFLNRPVEFVDLPWEKQIPAVLSGETDIIMAGMSVTRVRSLQIAFSRPLLEIGQMALVRKEDLSRFPDVNSVIHVSGRVGSIENTTGDFLTNSEFPSAKHKHFKTADQGARALQKGKIDLFITDSPYVQYWAKAKDDLAYVPLLLTEENLAWGLKKTSTGLLSQANQFLEKIKKDGSLRRLLEKWGLDKD